jgi:hypothetical protein
MTCRLRVCCFVVVLALVPLASPSFASSSILGWRASSVVLGSAYSAPGAAGRQAPGFGAGQETEEPDVRERRVGGRFPLEKELETDRSWDTWLYVFSALMLLCVGWLCFKPHRVSTGKGGLGLSLFRKKGAAAKPKKGKK